MDNNIPENFCMAPWIHAAHDTSNIRRPCAISRISSHTNFETLEEFKNSNELKNIRQQMMNGKLPTECKNCNPTAIGRTFVSLYKDSFNSKFGNYYKEALSKTSIDGYTTMETRFFDYRFDNTCNFKCRHCAPENSSLLEHEEEKHNLNYKSLKAIIDKNSRYQNLENEILTSADNGTLDELEWAGGESLFSEFHWKIMKYIVEHGKPSNIRASYITNLSIIEFKGIQLLDLLNNFKEVSIHASIESGGLAAEYIRDGLDWETWKNNFRTINNNFKNKSNCQIHAGITLTSFSLPGLRDYLEFLCQENARIAVVNMHNRSNPKNRHLDINSLGMYKKQWLDEYEALIEEYKEKLTEFNYTNLIAAVGILEKQPALDLDSDEIFTLQTSLEWSNKIDVVRKGITALDVIKDYPFMMAWWAKINTACQEPVL